MSPQDQQMYFLIGVLIGTIGMGFLCGLVPLITGIVKQRVALAVIGYFLCILSGFLQGLLLAGPVALVFFLIILCLGKPAPADDYSYKDRLSEPDYKASGRR